MAMLWYCCYDGGVCGDDGVVLMMWCFWWCICGGVIAGDDCVVVVVMVEVVMVAVVWAVWDLVGH